MFYLHNFDQFFHLILVIKTLFNFKKIYSINLFFNCIAFIISFCFVHLKIANISLITLKSPFY